jgi:hypothetical protein
VATLDRATVPFWRNEMYDFGTDDHSGAGIFFGHSTGTIGRDGHANFLHDGKAGAIVCTIARRARSRATASELVRGLCGLRCSSLTEFRHNQAVFTDVPFQAVANVAPVNYTRTSS